MQKLELPEALADIKAKIELLGQRIELINEGIGLYESLAAAEADTLKNYTYREGASKKREELIVYTEQLKSQQVYLAEFEKDLLQQKILREKQLSAIKEHLQQTLDTAKEHLKNPDFTEADRIILKSLREKFIKDQFQSDEERIMRYRELVNTLLRISKK